MPLFAPPTLLHAIAPRYSVTDLGALPGAAGSQAVAINDGGQVVGQSGTQAFLWERGRMRALPSLPRYTLEPRALNNRGQVVGVAWGADIHKQRRAFLWSQAHGTRDLGTPNGEITEAADINDAGQAVGTSYALEMRNGQQWHVRNRVFVWTPGLGFRTLDEPVGGGFANPTAINNHGQVVGSSGSLKDQDEDLGLVSPTQIPDMDGMIPFRAFLWDPVSLARRQGDVRSLRLPGAWSSHAVDINEAGLVLGTLVRYDRQTPTMSVYLWKNGVRRELKYLGLPAPVSLWRTRLNERGEFAGSYQDPGTTSGQGENYLSTMPGKSHVFVFRGGRAFSLDASLSRDPGWSFEAASGVNAQGQLVVNGIHEGKKHAFLLTPR